MTVFNVLLEVKSYVNVEIDAESQSVAESIANDCEFMLKPQRREQIMNQETYVNKCLSVSLADATSVRDN